MHRWTTLAACCGLASITGLATAQTPISQYHFNSDLLNASTFVDANMVEAPDGTYRQGATVAGSVAGTATFARGVDGTPSGALSLDGVDDWIDLTTAGHPGQPVPGTSTAGPGLISGTVMAWVRVTPALTDAPRWLLGNVNASSTSSYRFGWNGSRIETSASAANNTNSRITINDSTASTAWANGQWHHIAATWDGFVNQGRIYVDGAPLTSTLAAASFPVGSQQTAWEFPMALGARDNGGTLDGFWSGLVDDLRIYRERLSNAQVLAVFNATTIAPDEPEENADFDDDGDVDGQDFLTWQRGLGVGTTLAEGDADDDQDVDAADLAIWSAMFGQQGGPVAAIPEPGTAVLLAAALIAGLSRRRWSAS